MAKYPQRQCIASGCAKVARSGGQLCVFHGGKPFVKPVCTHDGCTKRSVKKGGLCPRHGGPVKYCERAVCNLRVYRSLRTCLRHSGREKCNHNSCKQYAAYGHLVCGKHGARPRCSITGCDKVAKGARKLCTAHGGGMLCKADDCTKGAREPFKFCKAHGGGVVCKIDGCTTFAIDGRKTCKKHGPRCAQSGCQTAPRTGYDFCVRHHGGKLCKAPGCQKSAQGATDYCIADGGGLRCNTCPPEVSVSVQFKGDRCYACRGGSIRKWEVYTTEMLQEWGIKWTYYNQELPCARSMGPDNCIQRPDYVFVSEKHVVILEVDETYHRYYLTECEVGRIGKLKDLVKLPMHLIRFNPGKKRYTELREVLEGLIRDEEGCQTPSGVMLHFLGYPTDRIQELKEDKAFCYEYKVL